MVYLVVTSKPQEADQSSVAYLQKLASYRNPQPETKACVWKHTGPQDKNNAYPLVAWHAYLSDRDLFCCL